MSDRSGVRRVPPMPADRAQEIACTWKALADSYLDAGMQRESSRLFAESQWWMTYAISLSQTPPPAGSRS